MSFIYPRPTPNYMESVMPSLVPISILTTDEKFINYSDEKERLKILQLNNISNNVINESSEKSQHIHEQQDEAKRDD